MPLNINCSRFETEFSIRINRLRGAEDRWCLFISDWKSGLVVAEIYMNDEQFSEYMSGTSTQCLGNLYKSPHHASKMEVRQLEVELPEELEDWDDFVEQVFREQVQMGWYVDRDKICNPHKRSRSKYYFTRRRWV